MCILTVVESHNTEVVASLAPAFPCGTIISRPLNHDGTDMEDVDRLACAGVLVVGAYGGFWSNEGLR